MEDQREALRKIITTLAVKNEEIQSFIYSLKQMLLNVEANSAKVQEDLEAEFQSLFSLLEELKEGMLMKIKQDRASRAYELQAAKQIKDGCWDLAPTPLPHPCCEGGNAQVRVPWPRALDRNKGEGVPYTHLRGPGLGVHLLPYSVTMAPAFRLSLKAKVSDNMSHLMVDFAQERRMLQALTFLPVPSAPVIDLAESLVADNCVTLVWRMPDEDNKIDHYVLEYRRTNFEGPPRLKEDQPWMVIEGIQQTEYTLTGLKFDMKYMNFRVKACNKAVSGEFSEPVTLETPGDTLIDGGEHYWEVRYEPDSKAFGLGVAYRSLGRFEQLGKTAASWCLYVNNWLQVSFTAKHANKAKVLDTPVPDCLGVHCDFHQGLLSFYNARTKQLLHTFKAKFTQPLLPAFTVWCGSFHVTAGLQVPSSVRCLQKRGSATSSSNTSLT
eukprot:bmy_15832T0